jgi:hypothetical protein
VSAGSYKFQVWTYPQFYEVPTATELGGITLPNAGTIVPYIPEDKVIVLPSSDRIDLKLLYGGIPEVVNRNDPRIASPDGLSVANTRASFLPYKLVDQKAVSVNVGVRSAPLCVPRQIDGFSVIDTEF